VTLIDLDLFALADPAVDVANFAAHLRLLAIQRLPDPAALDATAALFVQHYTQQAPQPPGFAERLAFYEASTYFRLMHVVLQRPRQHRRFEPLFELCERGPLLLGPYGG
jgi:aminoglycoside phosphotransferase (APT) family kinase protein